MSPGYEIINATSRVTRTSRVTALHRAVPSSAIPERDPVLSYILYLSLSFSISLIHSTPRVGATLRFTCVTLCVYPGRSPRRPPLPPLPAVTQNPSGVLTAYASGHVGMLDREPPPLLSLVHVRSRRTCANDAHTHDPVSALCGRRAGRVFSQTFRADLSTVWSKFRHSDKFAVTRNKWSGDE